MRFFNAVYCWLLRNKNRDNDSSVEDLGAKMAEDIGVRVTRVRLPSGFEVIIVRREIDEDLES